MLSFAGNTFTFGALRMKNGGIVLALCVLFHFPVFSQSSERALFPVLRSNSMANESIRAGYIDRMGNLAIGYKFYYASDFSEGLAAVQLTRNGAWGYINSEGELVIDPRFDKAEPFSGGIAFVEIKSRRFVISKKGRTLISNASGLTGFYGGLSPASYRGKWGFVSLQGSVVVPFQFDVANQFSEGLASVVLDGEMGYINKLGEWIITPRFPTFRSPSEQTLLPNFSEGRAVVFSDGKYGFIDREGKTVIRPLFSRASPFSGGLAAVCTKSTKCGYVGESGEIEIYPKYDATRDFSEGLAAVKCKNGWGFIDTNGKTVIEPLFESADSFKNGLAKVSFLDKKADRYRFGYLNRNGSIVYSWLY